MLGKEINVQKYKVWDFNGIFNLYFIIILILILLLSDRRNSFKSINLIHLQKVFEVVFATAINNFHV